MIRTCQCMLAVAALVCLSAPAMALPRLQTFAVGSVYENRYAFDLESSLAAMSRLHDVRIIGAWGGAGRSDRRDEVRLEVGMVRGQSNSININGVDLTSLNTAAPFGGSGFYHHLLTSAPGGSFYHVGAINDDQTLLLASGPVVLDGPQYYDDATNEIPLDGFRRRPRDDRHPNYATPEPGTLSLLGVGLLGLIPVVRRRLRAM